MSHLKTFLPYLFGNKRGKSYELPKDLNWESLSFEESLMFHTLRNDLKHFVQNLNLPALTSSQVFHLFSYSEHLPKNFLSSLKNQYQAEHLLFIQAKKDHVLDSLEVQEILNYKNYTLSVFAIFHSDRSRPGKLFIRKADGSFVHGAKGGVWSLPVLGISGRGLPFNHSNGTTPAGVYAINSVMPEANHNYEFGKFRRLIVDFLKSSIHEENIKQFLPRSHHKADWWSQAVVARELGRSLLRIHGTGRVNKNPFSPYFPMIPSSGCLTVTERSLLGLAQTDHQRQFLDTLMEALNLPKTYENESKIHGVLYVIPFDGKYQALEFKS